MIQTSRSDQIEDFIDFFQRIAGNDATAGRVGASSGEIARFASLCRFPLPSIYQGYLREFGRGEAMLNFSQDGYPHIDDLTRFYGAQAQLGYPDVPNNSVVIALEGVAEGKLLLYSSENPDEEPQVAAFYDTTIRFIESSSFRNYLYSTAFLRSRFPITRKTDVYLGVTKSSLIQSLTEFSLKLGFVPYWFCDDYAASLERQNDYLRISQYGSRTYLSVNCHDKQRSQELRTAFMGNFPLEDIVC